MNSEKIQKKRRKKIVLRSISFAIFFLAVIVCSSVFVFGREASEQGAVFDDNEQTIIENLPEGITLDDTVNKVTSEFVYYDYRVLKRYQYPKNTAKDVTQEYNTFFNKISDDIEKRLVIIPARITAEGYSNNKYDDGYIDIINTIKKTLSDDVIVNDTLPVLRKNMDDYVFYRTYSSLTANGYYHVIDSIMNEKGIDTIPLSEFDDNRQFERPGNMVSLANADYLLEYPDEYNVYIYDVLDNRQTLNCEKVINDEFVNITINSPIVSYSRGGNDKDIGGYVCYSIINTKKQEGKNLMVIGNKYSKHMIPLLLPYYKNIVFIETDYFREYEKFFNMVDDNNIDEMMVIQTPEDIEDGLLSSLFKDVL